MLTALALWACFASVTALQAADPVLSYAEPRGGQRGTTVEVKLVGDRLTDAEEILFHQPGITAKEITHPEKSNGKSFTVKFEIAADARLGEHMFQVRTRSGGTFIRRFWVSQFPNVLEEDGKNGDFETAQVIPVNSSIEGIVKPETIDYYKVTAKKGERISVEVEGLRANSISNRVAMDPYCAILNADRFALASSDDTPLLRQDCYVSVIAPEDGDYFVEIRDSAYQGNGRYRAHVGTFPRPSIVYPAGGKVGTEVEMKVLGDTRGQYTTKVKLPAEPTDEFPVFAAHGGQLPPSPNYVRVSKFDNILENEEKNESWRTLEKSSGNLPLAFNGILQEKTDAEGNAVPDYDYFRFTARKGEKFRFRAIAKGINSPVDPVLHVFDAAGKTVGGSDDADGSADSRYDFTAAADADYFVRVYDHLKRGGEDFVYRIESEVIEPTLVVTMPVLRRNDNQYRKSMVVPKGGRYATVVNVARQNVRTDATIDIAGLPSGVTLEADTIPSTQTQFPILLKAAPDAPIGGQLTELFAHSTDKEKPLTGKYTQEVDFVRGNPNATLYYAKTTDQLPVVVAEEAPFSLKIEEPKVPILQNGLKKLKVVATRKEGFTKPITVRMLWRPPGIGCNSTATIPEGKNETYFNMTANANAQVNDWRIVVMGEANDGKGTVLNASPLTPLSVKEPFVDMEVNLATVKQGQPVDVLIDVDPKVEFEGEAKVKLIGLPAKAAAEEIVLKHGQTQITFPVTTDVGTPVGQHKNIFCEVVFNKNGETITQRAGMGGVFRVDPKPKEPAKPKPEATQVAKADNKPKEKPLSRLEQLRLEAKQQAAQ